MNEPAVEAFDVASLEEARAEVQHRTGELYLEFLRRDSMSCGLYVLEAGATDPQEPHAEDEVYVVLAGRAVLEVEGERLEMQRGRVVSVDVGADHRFVDISEDLSVLVVFAPPDSPED